MKKNKLIILLTSICLFSLTVVGLASGITHLINDNEETSDTSIEMGETTYQTIEVTSSNMSSLNVSTKGFYDNKNKTYSYDTFTFYVSMSIKTNLSVDSDVKLTLSQSDKGSTLDLLNNNLALTKDTFSYSEYDYSSKKIEMDLKASNLGFIKEDIEEKQINFSLKFNITNSDILDNFSSKVISEVRRYDIKFSLKIELLED